MTQIILTVFKESHFFGGLVPHLSFISVLIDKATIILNPYVVRNWWYLLVLLLVLILILCFGSKKEAGQTFLMKNQSFPHSHVFSCFAIKTVMCSQTDFCGLENANLHCDCLLASESHLLGWKVKIDFVFKFKLKLLHTLMLVFDFLQVSVVDTGLVMTDWNKKTLK